MEDKSWARDSDPLQAVDRTKTRFLINMCISLDCRGRSEGLWVSRNMFRAQNQQKKTVLSERKATEAPRMRSPEEELQVQLVGPCVSGEGEHTSRSLFCEHFYTENPVGLSEAMLASKSS